MVGPEWFLMGEQMVEIPRPQAATAKEPRRIQPDPRQGHQPVKIGRRLSQRLAGATPRLGKRKTPTT